MGMGGQRHAPAALPPGKTLCPLYRSLGGPHGRSGRVRKIWPPTGIPSPDRPARSESLYRLGCPGPWKWYTYVRILTSFDARISFKVKVLCFSLSELFI